MARSISPSTPAFSNYGNGIHPVEKGGFGSNSLEGIRANINALDRTNTTTEGGVVPIGANGKANLAPYGVSSNSVTIKGPKFFNRTTTTEYTITNYSEGKEYTVSVSSGTATRAGNKITLSANIVPDKVILTINNRNITINKLPSSITAPMVSLGGIAYNDNKVSITATGSTFASASGKTHASSTWQIATDVLFGDIVGSSVDNTTNKTSYTFESIDKVPTLYVRVKYKDNVGEESVWSATASIDTSNLAIAVNTPSVSVTGKKTTAGAKLVIQGSPFVTADGGTHAATTWQVASDAAFSSIVFQSNADATNISTITATVNTISNTYYVRARHHSSVGNVSNWSNVGSVERGVMQDALPVNESAIFKPNPLVSSGYYGLLLRVSRDGNTALVYLAANLHIYVKNNNIWTLAQTLNTGGTYSSFDLSSDGNRIIVSNDYDRNGTISIYDRLGNVWSKKDEILSAYGGSLGYATTMSSKISGDGTRILYTSPLKNGDARVYKYNGTSWALEGTLGRSNFNEMPYTQEGNNCRFGKYSCFNEAGDMALITESIAYVRPDGVGGTHSPTVRMFIRTDSTWTYVNTVSGYTATSVDYIPSIRYSESGYLIVNDTFNGIKVTIFKRNANQWTLESSITNPFSTYGSPGNDGVVMSRDGSTLIIGSPNYLSKGAFLVYIKNGSTWKLNSTITASDGNTNDRFGVTVDVNDNFDVLFVSAWGRSTSPINGHGQIYIFG